MFQNLNKIRRISERESSRVCGPDMCNALTLQYKISIRPGSVMLARQLLIVFGKKRIYSSYANCNDSWFFFEGRDSIRAHS